MLAINPENGMLTAERVRELFSYEPDTGVLRRKISTSPRARAGNVAGGDNGQGYRVIKIDGRRYKAHRLVWLHVHGVWPSAEIDHIDGNPANNRLSNLREATHALNGRNKKRHADNASGFKGASWHKKTRCWQAQITLHGRNIYLGLFNTPEEAHAAYVEASANYHGEFGRVA